MVNQKLYDSIKKFMFFTLIGLIQKYYRDKDTGYLGQTIRLPSQFFYTAPKMLKYWFCSQR